MHIFLPRLGRDAGMFLFYFDFFPLTLLLIYSGAYFSWISIFLVFSVFFAKINFQILVVVDLLLLFVVPVQF
jgi:hypothetical protein